MSKKIACIIESDIQSKNKICIVHDGIDTERFSSLQKTNKLRAELNVRPNESLIGNIAALAGHKDHKTFVEMAAKLLQEDPYLHFVIIGDDGGEQERILRLIESLEIEDKVHLTGFRNDIEEIIRDLDVFVMSSSEEGLGTSILDAMAAEIPVVATAAGGIPEVVINEKTGLLCEIASPEKLSIAVRRLLDEEGLGSRLVTNAKKSLINFSKEKMAKGTIEIYREILKK